MPERAESQYKTRWALIGFLLTARAISQPMRANDRSTARAISICSPAYFLKVFSQEAQHGYYQQKAG